MMILKAEPISFQYAFGLLMTNAFAKQPVRGITAVQLNTHPFGLNVVNQIPGYLYKVDDIYYIGDPGCTAVSVSGMLRVIGQHLGEWSAWSHNVWHLRTILCGDDDGHDVYFEIAISGHLYICGGCTDCSGGGSNGKDTMDGVFACLSQMYGAKIETVKIPFRGRDAQMYVEDFIQRQTAPQEKLEEPKPGLYTFVAGQRVRFGDYAKEHKFCTRDQAKQTYVVEDTERIFFQCTCGLGEGVTILLHPERCFLRERREQMHHQFLHLQIDGERKRESGVLFEPA